MKPIQKKIEKKLMAQIAVLCFALSLVSGVTLAQGSEPGVPRKSPRPFPRTVDHGAGGKAGRYWRQARHQYRD